MRIKLSIKTANLFHGIVTDTAGEQTKIEMLFFYLFWGIKGGKLHMESCWSTCGFGMLFCSKSLFAFSIKHTLIQSYVKLQMRMPNSCGSILSHCSYMSGFFCVFFFYLILYSLYCLVCAYPLTWSPQAQWSPWSGWMWSLWLAAKFLTTSSSTNEWRIPQRQRSTQVEELKLAKSIFLIKLSYCWSLFHIYS